MAINPQKQSSEGEVVYRRVGFDARPAPASREPRIDPTLMPLLIGFALLLLFVIVLGNLSVRRVEDTSSQVLDLQQQHTARSTLLLQARIALTRLDNEARDRMEADARHELKPIVDLRLGTARDEVKKLLPLLDRAPLSEMPKWAAFRNDLQSYIEVTRDRR